MKQLKKEAFEEVRRQWADQINKQLREGVESEQEYRTIQNLGDEEDFGRMMVDFFITSLEHADTSLYAEFLSWLKSVLESRNLSPKYLTDQLDFFQRVIEDTLDQDSAEGVVEHLSKARKRWQSQSPVVESFINEDQPLGNLAREYFNALINADRALARKLIMDAVEEDEVPIRELYLHVFQAVQYEIGRLWQLNKISVAQEHFSTAVTQMIMSQLYPYIFAREKKGNRMMAASVGSELHEIGIRMVADFFEMEGWDTYYMGANVPTEDLMTEMKEKQPHLLALSATMTVNVPRVEALIAKIREHDEYEDLTILVGGYPFRMSENMWKEVGADGFALDAQEAIKIAEEKISN